MIHRIIRYLYPTPPPPDWTPIAIARRAAKERRNAAQAEQYIATHTALQGAVKAPTGE